MFQRVKQFICAITAKLYLTDEQYLAEYLTAAEQQLFRQMELPDQRHSLNVAYTAQQLAKHSTGLRLRLLIRAALLHDVGRTKNDLSTANKIFDVLFSTIFPRFARQWGGSSMVRCGNYAVERVHHVLFIYYHHGQIGARRLQELGIETDIIEMVARHHQQPAGDEPAELAILRQADQLN